MLETQTQASPLAQAFRKAADPESARDTLARYLPEARKIYTAKVLKTWPKPGGEFVFLYEILDEEGKSWAILFLFPPGSLLMRPTCPSRAGYVPEWNGYAQRFPNDYRLPHLRQAAVPHRARAHIEPFLDQTQTKWRGFRLRSIQPLSYWPSRKCMLQYRGINRENEPAHIYAKVYRGEDGRHILDIHGVLRAAGWDGQRGYDVPSPIGFCPELRAALFEPMQGKIILELLDSPLAAAAVDEVARLLEAFHKTPISLPLPVHGPAYELEVLQSWASVVAWLDVRSSTRVEELIKVLAGRVDSALRPVSPAHGDFYDKQLLYDQKTITVLDMDTVCLAPSEMDAGNFLIHLRLRGLEIHGDWDRYAGLGEAFLQGYRRTGGVLDSRALSWYSALACARLACRALIQPGGAGYFDPLILSAETIIDSQ